MTEEEKDELSKESFVPSFIFLPPSAKDESTRLASTS